MKRWLTSLLLLTVAAGAWALTPTPGGVLSWPSTALLGSQTLAYDPNGNTLQGAAAGAPLTCQYDWANRLTNAVMGGKTIALTYNADGHRVKKVVTEGGVVTTTTWLVDDRNPTGYAQVLEERQTRSTDPNPQTRFYVYGLDLLRQRRSVGEGVAEETRYFGHDGHGSARFLTDASGAVTDTYAYDAFGTLLDAWHAGAPTPNVYLYAGEEWDFDLGLSYNRARYLNPDKGRFWTLDTFEGHTTDSLSLQKYLYAHADPVNRIDPSGNIDFTLSGLLSSTAIQLTLRTMAHGALYGAAFGAGDAYFGERDVLEGALDGAVVGAFLGPLGRVRALRPVLMSAGAGLGIYGAYDAFMDGDNGLALYRGLTFVAGFKSILRGPARTGNVSVYRSVNAANGEVNYVGITVNFEARAAAHLRTKGISIRPLKGLENLSRADARAVEQVLIQFYGLGKNGGTLLNMINSIASSNPGYANVFKRGASLLSRAGYEGFQEAIPTTWAEIVLGDEDSIFAGDDDE